MNVRVVADPLPLVPASIRLPRRVYRSWRVVLRWRRRGRLLLQLGARGGRRRGAVRVSRGVAVSAGGVGGGPAVFGLRPPALHLVLVAQAAVLARRCQLTWREKQKQHAHGRTNTHTETDTQARTHTGHTRSVSVHDAQMQTCPTNKSTKGREGGHEGGHGGECTDG